MNGISVDRLFRVVLLGCLLALSACGATGETDDFPEYGSDLSFAGTPIRVACGATAPYRDSAGNVWTADAGFGGGNALTSATTSSIHGTADAMLYTSERWGASTYHFTVPNGSYAINLKFAESYVSGPHQREFDVRINGKTVLTDFDIFASAGGKLLPVDEQFGVDVTGGSIQIEFVPGAIQSPKIDAIEVMPSVVPPSTVEAPYLKLRAQIPGRIDAVNYDVGGEGVAYNEVSAKNQGGVYRPSEAIGIKSGGDDGGFVVGWNESGRWLKYTVQVSKTGTYAFTARVASAMSSGAFHVESDGHDITGRLVVPATGAWDPDVWTTLQATVVLTAGDHVLKLVVDAEWFDLDWIAFTPSAAAPPSPAPPPGEAGLPTTFFGMTQIRFGAGFDTTGISYGVLRGWNTPCVAGLIEPSPHEYSFTSCDIFVRRAIAMKAMPVLTMGAWATWAISGPCTGVFAGSGRCAQLPSDLNGANTITRDFLTAFATHMSTTFPGVKWAVEGQNESDLEATCAANGGGHCSQVDLVKYQKTIFQTLKSIDKTILVLGPSASSFNQYGVHLYQGVDACPTPNECTGAGFLAAGGGAWIDGVSIHPYFYCGGSTSCQAPETALAAIQQLTALLAASGIPDKPVYLTESDWGNGVANTMSDDMKSEWMGRLYMYAYNAGYAGVWWYSWDTGSVPLADAFGSLCIGPSGSCTPIAAVTTYATLYEWLVGSTHTVNSCNQDVDGHSTWSCPLVSRGKPSEILFNGGGDQTIAAPSGATTQFHLDGSSSPIVGGKVVAGPLPILVQ